MVTAADENDLIRSAQKGDVNAFEALVGLHERKILGLIMTIVGNRQDAYDIHQETFIRAFRHLPGFRYECQLSSWLGRIAVNQSINWQRQQRRYRFWGNTHSEESLVHSTLTSDNSPMNTEHRLLNEELRTQIERGIAGLPQQQRTVFTLKHMQGYKIREIAQLLDCAEGTIKHHLFRATKTLKKHLTPYMKGEV